MAQLNALALRRLFGIPNPTLQSWLSEGLPHDNTEYGVRFTPADVFHWRESQLLKAAAKSQVENEDTASLTMVEAKRRGEIAKMTLGELDVAIKRDELTPIAEIIEELGNALMTVRTALVPLPTKMGGLLSYQDEDTIIEKLGGEIQRILDDLSEYEHRLRGDSDDD